MQNRQGSDITEQYQFIVIETRKAALYKIRYIIQPSLKVIITTISIELEGTPPVYKYKIMRSTYVV